MKKFKIEYLLYIFIIISPILDVLACVFHNIFPSSSISPSTILRPLIPLILLLYIFIKDKRTRKYIFLSALVFMTYGIIHLYLFNIYKTGITHGSIFQELQYVVNYTYMIYVLFIFLYFYKKTKLPKLENSLIIMLALYIVLIYLAILTRTSYPTYVEGMGYRGWFTSGNSLSTILVILYASLINRIISRKKIYEYLLIILLGIYLVFLVGTRTGLYGFVFVTVFYILSKIISCLKNKVKIKLSFWRMFLCFVIGASFIFTFIIVGSNTLKRRHYMDTANYGIIDIYTGTFGHTTGDTAVFYDHIKHDLEYRKLLSKYEEKAYVSMYEYANKKKINPTNTRYQQIVYNFYLMKYQNNILSFLFGNGYVNNYGEMILEMEVPALFFNFGILGFIYFLFPFISIIIREIILLIKKRRKVNMNYIMSMFGIVLAFGLSSLAGYVLFSVSCVLILIVNLTLIGSDEA